MREILFRGKRTDNGEFVSGYLTQRPSAIQYGAHYSPWFIDTPPSDPEDSSVFYNVDGATVGQFTGLTDKNGEKIFEGDIVRTHMHNGRYYEEITGVITYVKNHMGFGIHNISAVEIDFIDAFHHRLEVLGNVFDNRELLEGE